MDIDRAETPDAIRRGPERGTDTTERADLVRTDPEARATVHRLYRVLVDHVYGKAHDAWAQALPDLRATWGKLEEKYPERTAPTPRTQPDGSWVVAGGDRKLTPDQNAEATRACADIRAEGERVILLAMERVEAADPSRRLAGLEHMLKGEDRIQPSAATPCWTSSPSMRKRPNGSSGGYGARQFQASNGRTLTRKPSSAVNPARL